MVGLYHWVRHKKTRAQRIMRYKGEVTNMVEKKKPAKKPEKKKTEKKEY